MRQRRRDAREDRFRQVAATIGNVALPPHALRCHPIATGAIGGSPSPTHTLPPGLRRAYVVETADARDDASTSALGRGRLALSSSDRPGLPPLRRAVAARGHVRPEARRGDR